jgi:hypothetical protein
VNLRLLAVGRPSLDPGTLEIDLARFVGKDPEKGYPGNTPIVLRNENL